MCLQFCVSKVNNGILFSHPEAIAGFMSVGLITVSEEGSVEVFLRRKDECCCHLWCAACHVDGVTAGLDRVSHARVSCAVWLCSAEGASWKLSSKHRELAVLGG